MQSLDGAAEVAMIEGHVRGPGRLTGLPWGCQCAGRRTLSSSLTSQLGYRRGGRAGLQLARAWLHAIAARLLLHGQAYAPLTWLNAIWG